MIKKKRLLLTAAATLGLTVSALAQVPAYVPTNGLVGWWPFNGNANDESGNGNNGTVNGATLTSDRFGISNKAFSFDGSNDYIGCYSYPLSQGFTISIWYKTSNNLNTAQKQLYFQAFNEFNISREVIPGKISFGVKLSNDTYYFTTSNSSATNITFNQWVNVVGSYFPGDKSRLFINGQAVDSTEILPNLNLWTGNSLNSTIGAYSGNYQFWDGELDDIGIWNRALTQQEITNLYTATICANDLVVSPQANLLNTGNTATFTTATSDPNPVFVWQSDFGQGFQTLNDVGNYLGTTTGTLSISTIQLANHNQPIRAIATSGNCIDTSNVASIQITDTCITTISDTVLTTVTDTLIIQTTLGLPAPNNENTLLIYPNPANDHITIDNGNYTAMAGYSLKITNNAGQQVFQSAINQAQFYVDLSTWTGNGLYFVHLMDPQNNTVTIRKLVLQ